MTLLKFFAKPITGIIHIGAHEAQELKEYLLCGCKDVLWVEADPSKLDFLTEKIKSHPDMRIGIFAASDTDNETQILNIANNEQSSSLLDFGTHSDTHRDTVYIQTIPVKTQRVDTWIKTLDVDNTIYNAANIDVQGYELKVLKGMSSCLSRLKVIELEVNTEEVYKGCALIHEIDDYLSHYKFRRVYVNMWGQGYGSALYLYKPNISDLLVSFLSILTYSIRKAREKVLSKISYNIYKSS